jgi:hypothetical protein
MVGLRKTVINQKKRMENIEACKKHIKMNKLKRAAKRERIIPRFWTLFEAVATSTEAQSPRIILYYFVMQC